MEEADAAAGCEVLGRRCRGRAWGRNGRALLAPLLQHGSSPGRAVALQPMMAQSGRPGTQGVRKRGHGFQDANFSLWGNVLT